MTHWQRSALDPLAELNKPADAGNTSHASGHAIHRSTGTGSAPSSGTGSRQQRRLLLRLLPQYDRAAGRHRAPLLVVRQHPRAHAHTRKPRWWDDVHAVLALYSALCRVRSDFAEVRTRFDGQGGCRCDCACHALGDDGGCVRGSGLMQAAAMTMQAWYSGCRGRGAGLGMLVGGCGGDGRQGRANGGAATAIFAAAAASRSRVVTSSVCRRRTRTAIIVARSLVARHCCSSCCCCCCCCC